MSREKVEELLRRRSTKVGSIILAAAIVFSGSMWAWKDSKTTVPELVTFVDVTEDATIEEEATPLAKPKLSQTKATLEVGDTLTLKVKNNKKKVKWSTSSKKTATVTNKGKITAKKAGNVTITAKVGKKKYTCKLTVTSPEAMNVTVNGSKQVTGGTTTAAATATETTAATSAFIAKRQEAFAWGNVTPKVASAFNTLGMKLVVNAGVNYDGRFEAKTGTITVKAENGTVYHELGHFLAFVVGNYDTSSKFASVYNAEKGLYTEYNKAYVCSNASEYFAESFCQYVLVNGELKASRPQTYAAVEEALSKLTDAQVSMIQKIYGSLWK